MMFKKQQIGFYVALLTAGLGSPARRQYPSRSEAGGR